MPQILVSSSGSSKVSWNRWLGIQVQGFGNALQNWDFAKAQLWALDVNYWSLSNTWQGHLLEQNRNIQGSKNKYYVFIQISNIFNLESNTNTSTDQVWLEAAEHSNS